MILIVMFDKDADIVDVPQSVIDNKDVLRKKFLRWIYSKSNSNRQKVNADVKGRGSYGVKYRSDSFVDWLNKKVLCNCDE